MKKYILLAGLILSVNFANAELREIADEVEKENIALALRQALAVVKIHDCKIIKEGREVNVLDSLKRLPGSSQIYREDNGQPVLMLIVKWEDNSWPTQYYLTTDSTGKEIVKIDYQYAIYVEPKKVNKGTVAYPKFEMEPGYWKTTVNKTCVRK